MRRGAKGTAPFELPLAAAWPLRRLLRLNPLDGAAGAASEALAGPSGCSWPAMAATREDCASMMSSASSSTAVSESFSVASASPEAARLCKGATRSRERAGLVAGGSGK